MYRALHITLAVALFGLTAYSCTGKSNKTINSNSDGQTNGNKAVLLSVDDFEKGFTADSNAQLIDVRTPEEVKDGYIKGAININYQGDNFASEIAKLDKTKPTYVYCRSGGRSAEACSYMANQNFTKLFDLDGGFTAWSHYKKPIEIPQE